MVRDLLSEIDGINFLDIGSSGNLDDKWKPIFHLVNLIGFDPNTVECLRMAALPHPFRSVKYLPYAIAGTKESTMLHKTKSIYCYSLLRPNKQWLDRFAFHELFDVTGVEPINTEVLSNVPEVKQMDVDVVKTDTQGLELPILRSSSEVLEKAFFVETETGFVENYMGETTFSQIDEFMRAHSFLLFDINTSHRISRRNVFKDQKTGREQLLWCEATWLKDYVQVARKGGMSKETFNRQKVLKALVLCSLQGCIDYGYEIATLAFETGNLSKSELVKLESRDGWSLFETKSPSARSIKFYKSLINYSLRLLPVEVRRRIKEEADKAVHQKHLLRR
jgi:hypothetical protein